jgi:hypothetical protein
MATTLPTSISAHVAVAVAVAARKTGDKVLEEIALEDLRTKHGIELRFLPPRRTKASPPTDSAEVAGG